jgi:hypothetical protein
MLRIRKALREAKQAGASVVEVPMEDLERLMAMNQQMDQRLAQCMSKLSREDHMEIFGDLFQADDVDHKV